MSGLIDTFNNKTLFYSNSSGNVLFNNIFIEVSGNNSQVYNLTSSTGFEAIECNTVNYNNCSSLGTLTNFRQGLELNTGRFGGSPSLTLEGTWLGGFRISTSIVRALGSGMTEPLFKEGSGLKFNSTNSDPH